MITLMKKTGKTWIKKILAQLGFQIVRIPKPVPHKPDFDEILTSYLAHINLQNFYFIQIGAFDGITNDPLFPFICNHHLKGVLIEPQKGPFLALQENYQDQPQLKFLNVAISSEDGARNFYTVRNDVGGLPNWSQQIGSFNLEHLIKHKNGVPDYGILQGIPNIEELIEVHEIQVMCFDSLLALIDAKHLDLLQIDAEGYDYELIKLFSFKRLKPKIIHYEHMHLSQADQIECERYLSKLGYKINSGFSDTTAFSF